MNDYSPFHYQQMRELARIALLLEENVMSQLSELQAAVAAQSTVITSAVALLDGLVVKLQAAAVSVANGDGGAALTAVIHDVQKNTDALAAAVAADTAATATEVVPESTVAATLPASDLDPA